MVPYVGGGARRREMRAGPAGRGRGIEVVKARDLC